jgi:hypothetical protein
LHRRVVTGAGRFVFEVVSPWGNIPEELGAVVSDVAVDSAGSIHLYQRGRTYLITLDSNGDVLRAMGSESEVDAHGLCVDDADRLLMIDRDGHRLVRMDLSGRIDLAIERWPGRHLGEPFLHPADVAVSEEGDIYVADGYGNARIHRFTSKGEHVTSWGTYGKHHGKFRVPHGVWVGGGVVYVADRENDRLQTFTTDGRFVDSWAYFYRPTDVFVSDGVVFVTDMLPSITILSIEGRVLSRCRLPLTAAHGLWGDVDGSLYVVDGASQTLCKLIRQPSLATGD